MNKIKKNCLFAMVGLSVLMMTAVSVSASDEDEPGVLERDEFDLDDYDWNQTDDSNSTGDEPNLISPSPDEDLGSLIAAPESELENEEESSGDNGLNTVLIFAVGITGVVGVAGLIIYKKKN